MAINTNPIAGGHSIIHALATVDTAPTNSTRFADIVSIGDFEVTTDTDDYHVYQNDWQQRLPTTKSGGDVEIEAVFTDDARLVAIEAAFAASTLLIYCITYAAAGGYTVGVKTVFQAYVTNLTRMTPIDAKIALKFTLAIHDSVVTSAL